MDLILYIPITSTTSSAALMKLEISLCAFLTSSSWDSLSSVCQFQDTHCKGPFLTKSKPKLKQGPWARLLWFKGTGLGSLQLNGCLQTKWCTEQWSYKKYMLASKNISEQQAKAKRKATSVIAEDTNKC